MRAMRRVQVAVACLALTLPALVVATSEPSGAAPARIVDGLQTVQRLAALPFGAVRAGAVPSRQHLSMRVVLSPRDPAALSSFIAAASTPSSPRFRRYVARDQFARRFGPTSQAIQAVRAQLRRDGLAVTALSPSHLVLSVSGAASRFAAALHAPLVRWRLPNGALGYRLGRAARLPAAVARYVTGVIGVSSLVRERSLALRLPVVQRVGNAVRPRLAPSAPCSAAAAALFNSGSFSPIQEGQAYGLQSAWSHGYDGAGRTVAVEEFAPYSSDDVLAYDKCFGLLPPAATSDPLVHNVHVDAGTSPGSASSSDEPTLDIEEIRALAPSANVLAYLGPNNVTGPIDTLQRIATDDTAQAVSISWGICEAFSDHADETPIFEQMAAQGQTVFAASGDSGSSDCIGQSPSSGAPLVAPTVDDPASQPLVTGVGGLTVNSISPLSEVVWNDCSATPGCMANASGGGISSAYPRPAWQVAPGTPTGSTPGAHARLVPDLSVIGDPATGMLIYYEGSYQGIGGTSMGAPLMAALDVVAAQSCSASTLGFLNPLLYAMGRHGGDFDDVTQGNNAIATSTFRAHQYDATPGYDMASGLGSPKPSTFLPALCDGPGTATARPITPGVLSDWTLTYHSGAEAYGPTATMTVTAPPGTTMPKPLGQWLVSDTPGSGAPSKVVLGHSPSSTTDNVATLTPVFEPAAVDLVTVSVVGVENPRAVGTASVTITDSVDHLAVASPLSLATPTPSSVTSTVRVTTHRAGVGSAGVTVTATVRDAAGDAVLGARVTATATGHGRTLVLHGLTNGLGVAAFSFRDDRVETSRARVSASGTPVGSVGVAFTDPWRSHALRVQPRLGRVLGAPAVTATGHGRGWVGLVRVAGGGLDVVVPHGARLDAAALRDVPLAVDTPSLVHAGGWLYAAYRSTAGHLVVLRQGGGDHLAGWRAEDLTRLRRATEVLGDPRTVVAGHGAGARLSIAWVSRSRLVERTTASLRSPTRFVTLDLTDAASLPTSATGDVAEVPNGPDDAFVFATTDGHVLMIARARSGWTADDLAQSAFLGVTGGDAIAGSPTAVVSPFGFTVAVATRNRRIDEFVGTFDNWTAEAIVAGAAGSSPPAGHATLPSFEGDPVVVATDTATDVVVQSTSGRLVELSSLGVADPWSAYDLTTLGRLPHGGSTGAVAVPGRTLSLLCAVGGRLVVIAGGAV